MQIGDNKNVQQSHVLNNIIMIFKRCLICKEILHESRATEMHENELKALKVYLIFIDIFLTGTNHGCQFSINVVAAHTLNISKI